MNYRLVAGVFIGLAVLTGFGLYHVIRVGKPSQSPNEITGAKPIETRKVAELRPSFMSIPLGITLHDFKEKDIYRACREINDPKKIPGRKIFSCEKIAIKSESVYFTFLDDVLYQIDVDFILDPMSFFVAVSTGLVDHDDLKLRIFEKIREDCGEPFLKPIDGRRWEKEVSASIQAFSAECRQGKNNFIMFFHECEKEKFKFSLVNTFQIQDVIIRGQVQNLEKRQVVDSAEKKEEIKSKFNF